MLTTPRFVLTFEELRIKKIKKFHAGCCIELHWHDQCDHHCSQTKGHKTCLLSCQPCNRDGLREHIEGEENDNHGTENRDD